MADSTTYKVIRKDNPGLPDQLDWESLRAAGIDYLGKLGGKIWTDHNVHDPGITILEVLCYAITDLAYRTSLPAEEILARNPAQKGKDDNFFTPAEILTCNPTTINDYRKMLVDIDGVRNAWLQDAFPACAHPEDGKTPDKETGCSLCLNGLYHVLIEPEKFKEKDDPGDFYDPLLKRIREVLMAHRNLCEDFVDIRILCPQYFGLCANIELETGANAEQVYNQVLQRLQDFCSPTPRFYTLQQLLEQKKRKIEDIFSGRPYNWNQSHGFVDQVEFEQLRLRKELHLSDVYEVIFQVPGVRDVSELGWKPTCQAGEKANRAWIWKLPTDHVPRFRATCSSFHFYRQHVEVNINQQHAATLFDLNVESTDRLSYRSPSPYLDAPVQQAPFRADLGQYRSVQIDLPRVYGVREGGLPPDISNQRKAQALQLKGYLLFYDQLLANYCAQLQHIRSLFAFGGPKDEADRHTYFLETPQEASDLDKLYRFSNSNPTAIGHDGDTVAVPVKMSYLNNWINAPHKQVIDLLGGPAAYVSDNLDDCRISAEMVRLDMQYGNKAPVVLAYSGECWMYYLALSTPDLVLVGTKTYDSEQQARDAANLVSFAGHYPGNYRTFMRQDGTCSFSIDLRLNHYQQFLQNLTESKDQYVARRNGFLDHLLSRFAEQFTDYALLSYGVTTGRQLAKNEIVQKELFLSNYPVISANRGTGYDYLKDGWNNENISGFERRTFALAGMGELKRKFVCHFVVEPFEENYLVNLQLNPSWVLFHAPEKYYSVETAQNAAESFFRSAGQLSGYGVERKSHGQYQVFLCGAEGKKAYHPMEWPTEPEALAARNRLFNIFNFEPDDQQVRVSREVYRTIVINNDKHELAESRSFSSTPEDAEAKMAKMLERVARPSEWLDADQLPKFREVIAHSDGRSFTDLGAYHIMTGQWLEDEPEKFGFFVWVEGNHFRFNSMDASETEEEARRKAQQLIIALTGHPQLQPVFNTDLDKYELQVMVEGKAIGASERKYDTSMQAAAAGRDIVALAHSHVYSLSIARRPYRYKYISSLGHEPTGLYEWMSEQEYSSRAEALNAAKDFYHAFSSVKLKQEKNNWFLDGRKGRMKMESVAGGEVSQQEMDSLLKEKQKALALQKGEEADFAPMVTNDIRNPKYKYVFRLVDKNNVRAVFRGNLRPPASASDALSLKKELYQLSWANEYLRLATDSDAVVKRMNGQGVTKYYFQLRCINGNQTGFPYGLVLFESVTGYASETEAVDAFNANYLEVIMSASREENYGKDKPIGFAPSGTEMPDSDSRSLAFVPVATQEIYQWYPDVIAHELATLAKRYPVRYARKEDDEFYLLFPCEADERDPNEKDGCRARPLGDKYYYFSISDNQARIQWISKSYFLTSTEALDAFRYFLMLLRYPGNFCIEHDFCKALNDGAKGDDCPAHWQVCLREVLAESTERFVSKDDAWEKVEEMVAVSQTEGAFQTWFNAEECRYTFDVSCQPLGLVHPCRYDSEEKAQEAISRLIEPLRSGEWKIPMLTRQDDGSWEWIDTAGKPIAALQIKKLVEEDFPGVCQFIFKIFLPAIAHGEFGGKDGRYILSYKGERIAESVGPWPDKEAWMHRMKWSACYFPIVQDPDTNQYFVNFKLPGFSCCGPEEWPENHCSPEEENAPGCNCCSAWKSECCFTTCREALTFLQQMVRQMTDRKNYQVVFDCECGPYHIRLHTECGHTPADTKKDRSIRQVTDNCCRDILAHNPQYFGNPRWVCEAVARAKKLINTEGFHVIEHILLRPRCAEDCRDYCLPRPCDNPPLDCTDWTWVVPEGADPCTRKEENIPFVPGSDPYSFLATVILPSWPERFRGPNKRAEVEKLLYQEAPAQVMLRILWLKPADFCRLESQFKKWVNWNALGRKGNCFDKNPSCDLQTLLLGTPYDLPNDAKACIPCATKEPEPESCFEKENTDCQDRGVQVNISEIFCWSTGVKGKQMPELLRKEVESPRSNAEKAVAEETERTRKPETPLRIPTEKEKVNFINSRIHEKYEIILNDLAEQGKENRWTGEIRKFMTTRTNLAEKYAELVEKLQSYQDAEGKHGGKPLNRTDARRLISIITESLFDKWLLFGADKKEVTRTGKILDSLREDKWIYKSLYHKWYDESIEPFALGLSTDEIRYWATGEK